jgi:hypothetical protein
MGHLLDCRSELHALLALNELVLKEGLSNGNCREVLSCLVQIPFNEKAWRRFRSFEKRFLKVGGRIAKSGWFRATRVYTNPKNYPQKPSYLARLIDYPDKPRRTPKLVLGLNQLDKISNELAQRPGLSNLSFVVLRAADLFDQTRPGYVPCVIAGDFKFRCGELHLNVMLRTSDVFSVMYADIFYLRQIQSQVLGTARKFTRNKELKNGKVGNLNLYLSRAFIKKSHSIPDRTSGTIGRVRVEPLAQRLVKSLHELEGGFLPEGMQAS